MNPLGYARAKKPAACKSALPRAHARWAYRNAPYRGMYVTSLRKYIACCQSLFRACIIYAWIKNKERPLGEDKWAWHRKSRGEWAGPCSHLHMWVGPSFFCACTCSQCNQQRTRVRAEALLSRLGQLALLTHDTGGAGPCKAQNGGRSKWCTPLLTRDNEG